MSRDLHSLNRGYIRDHIGDYNRVIQGDSRSLDCSSYEKGKHHHSKSSSSRRSSSSSTSTSSSCRTSIYTFVSVHVEDELCLVDPLNPRP